jgi:two-component system LytT family response regulator
MTRLLIIEDEPLAAGLIESMAIKHIPNLHLEGICDSIDASVAYLSKQRTCDLIIMDVHLADGISFEIFKQVKISAPVIFTTAFDQYAIQAFKVHSIDYLLKPIQENEFMAAIEKYKNLKNKATEVKISTIQALIQNEKWMTSNYKTRFLFRKSDRLIPIETIDMAYLMSEDKLSFCKTRDGKLLHTDLTLDAISAQLNPEYFFRANRKYIITRDVLQDIRLHLNGKIKITIKECSDTEVYVSKERASDFKKWLGA